MYELLSEKSELFPHVDKSEAANLYLRYRSMKQGFVQSGNRIFSDTRKTAEWIRLYQHKKSQNDPKRKRPL